MPGTEYTDLSLLVNQNTIPVRITEWVRNFRSNLKYIQGGYGASSLVNMLPDVPVIIVGSGPSLDRNIAELKGLENRALIITCASALMALQNHGVHPHVVFVSESKAAAMRNFTDVDPSKYNFVADSFLSPVVADYLQDAKRVYWFNTPEIAGCPFSGALEESSGPIGKIHSGGCGATTAWSLGVSICLCNPNILVGMTEAYYDPYSIYSHAVMSTHNVTTYSTAVEITEDAGGMRCYTNKAYKSFALWFEDAFIRLRGTHINCSEGGIIKDGCLIMPLALCKQDYLTVEYLDIEAMLFRQERQIDTYGEMIGVDLSSDRAFLTMLLEGLDIPSLALRMGWTDQQVAGAVIRLREMGVNISEKPATRTDVPTSTVLHTLAYTLERPTINLLEQPAPGVIDPTPPKEEEPNAAE